MIYRKNKKASLQLSVQSIVIMVLAMTLLGLGIGFIKGMFGDIRSMSEATFAKIKDQLQKDLVDGTEKVMFSEAKFSIERGESKLLAWGVKNEGATVLDYYVEFSAVKCPGTCPTLGELNDEWFDFKYEVAYSLGAAENHVKRVDLSIPKGSLPGRYVIELAICNQKACTTVYESTEFFLTVT